MPHECDADVNWAVLRPSRLCRSGTSIGRMQAIRLNSATGVPVFRQIVEQVVYMIEMGELDDGDRLPSSRMLADNLHVNRNTVVRAYAELQTRGLVSRRGRHGMVVSGA